MIKIKLLIISPLFAPNNRIGALRPTKIAGLLADKGYEIDVVTEGGTGDSSYAVPERIHKIYNMKPYSAPNEIKPKPIGSYPKHLRLCVRVWRHIYFAVKGRRKEKEFFSYFKKLYSSELKNNKYDTVFTTYNPISSLMCGLYIKKKCPNINWICDFRDPAVVDLTPKSRRRLHRSLQDRSCEAADKIVSVSNGYIKAICKDKYTDKRYMIPNGYDKTDFAHIDAQTPTDKLTITYVGALYNGERDASVLFKAISELCGDGEISLDKIRFNYAGAEFGTLKSQAQNYSVESILENHGSLSRGDCLTLQANSHFLLLLTWNTKSYTGVFPGKFLEYMLINRPVISLTSGDLAGGEVTEVLREGNLGIAYEEANDAIDYAALKIYIKEQYDRFINTGATEFSPKKSVVERYDWNNLIKKIEDLL